MKKYILFPFLTLSLLISCSKSNTENTDNGDEAPEIQPTRTPIVFRSEASKVDIVGYALQFTEGDNIAVASYNFANETTPVCSDYALFDGPEPSASGTFTPKTYEYGDDWAGEAGALSFYSYYPTSSELPSISGTTATVANIAATQNGTLSSIVCWAKGSNIATAEEVKDGNVPSFSYSPVCALVKLTIKNDDTVNDASINVSWTATSDGNIAGNASLNLLTGVLSGGDSKTITYSNGASPIEIEKEEEINIFLSFIPGTISEWELSITDTRENFVFNYSLDRDLPTTLLPGRLYSRTLSISNITGVTGASDTYAGVPFVRGFLKRNTTTFIDGTTIFSISDATENPLELLTYMNKPDGTEPKEGTYSEDAQHMYFGWNELNTIFGGTEGQSFESNTITINNKGYKVASLDNIDAIFSTTRSENSPTINGTDKAWSLVKVTLADSDGYENKGFDSNKTPADFVRGILFFPDRGSVVCSSINANNCIKFDDATWNNPNTISTAQLKSLVKGGCMFVLAAGGQSGTDWISRGNAGLYWSSSRKTFKGQKSQTIYVFTTDGYAITTNAYGRDRHFPVLLVKAD